MSAAHTPGPWTVREQGDANSYALLTANGHWLISFLQNGELMTATQRANAEFIVRACNAHDELLSALQEMLATVAGQYDSARHCRAVDAARAAIAKAVQS